MRMWKSHAVSPKLWNRCRLLLRILVRIFFCFDWYFGDGTQAELKSKSFLQTQNKKWIPATLWTADGKCQTDGACKFVYCCEAAVTVLPKPLPPLISQHYISFRMHCCVGDEEIASYGLLREVSNFHRASFRSGSESHRQRDCYINTSKSMFTAAIQQCGQFDSFFSSPQKGLQLKCLPPPWETKRRFLAVSLVIFCCLSGYFAVKERSVNSAKQQLIMWCPTRRKRTLRTIQSRRVARKYYKNSRRVVLVSVALDQSEEGIVLSTFTSNEIWLSNCIIRGEIGMKAIFSC